MLCSACIALIKLVCMFFGHNLYFCDILYMLHLPNNIQHIKSLLLQAQGFMKILIIYVKAHTMMRYPWYHQADNQPWYHQADNQ